MSDRIMEFFHRLDREKFLDEDYRDYAHYDNPLPIGHGQTISQPTLVLQMTMELELEKTHRVLEIGTGSGYQTAFLAEFAREVYTVERIEALSEKAQGRLKKLGYGNIRFKIGDGSLGWPENAPFDRIIVTAAAGKFPENLERQLAPGGRMLVPVGERKVQELVLVTKRKDGVTERESISQVRFVELVGDFGWNEWKH